MVVAPASFKGGFGYLHILPRKPFTKVLGNGLGLIAYEPVVPTEVLTIHPRVLEELQKNRNIRIVLPSTP